MLTVLIRTFIIYIILLVSMKLMGKRQVGELQLSELVTTLMLSELAVTPIGDKNIPLSYAVFPILILLSLEVIFSFCLTKINILKKLIYGKPSFLVRKGKLDQSELARLRISIDEFLAELRQKDISDLSDVDYAILEDNGKLSVIQKGGNGFSHPLVVDGELVDDEIMQYGVTKERIQEILSSKGLSLSEVFLFTADDKGNTLLIKRTENKEKK